VLSQDAQDPSEDHLLTNGNEALHGRGVLGQWFPSLQPFPGRTEVFILDAVQGALYSGLSYCCVRSFIFGVLQLTLDKRADGGRGVLDITVKSAEKTFRLCHRASSIEVA
jgi:hypothetical protein